MSIITSQVNIKKRYWESPSIQERYHEPYKWSGSVSTDDEEYQTLTLGYSYYGGDHISAPVAIKPTYDYLCNFAREDGYSSKHYYLCEFQMSDFSFNGKVNIDMGCDETGRHFYVDMNDCKYYSTCENPFEDEANTFYVNRLDDGTFHLNSGYELLMELIERGYNGSVWAIVSDNCD